MVRSARRLTPRVVWEMLRDSVKSFADDRAMRLSAALAYYSIFSLAPLLVIAVALAGSLFGFDAVRREVEQQLATMMGTRTAHAVVIMMDAWQKRGSSWAPVFSVVALVLGASGVFGQLQDALNAIWKVKAKPGRSIGRFLRDRFLSLTMVLGTGFLLLVSLILTTLLNAFAGRVQVVVPLSEGVARVLNSSVSFTVVTLLFAMIFKFLPDVKVRWRDVWIGAIGTALLFTGGKELLGWYLGRESTVSAYGAAGSIVVIVLWVYYASLILFLGAEFIRVFAQRTGSGLKPSQYAVPVTTCERARQDLSRGGTRKK